MFFVCRRFLQQDFDATLAFVNNERKQRTEVLHSSVSWMTGTLALQLEKSGTPFYLFLKVFGLSTSVFFFLF